MEDKSKQSYTYSMHEGKIKQDRNGNRSLQRNMANLNQPLINRNGYNYLNQSVEGDMLMINSKFSPTNNGRFGYVNGEVKRTNSSIKINPESNDVVMPLENKTNHSNLKAGRMCSTLNHFYKKKNVVNKPKQKHITKTNIYSHNNDYMSNEKIVAVNEQRKRHKKSNNQFLITSHPYMQDRSSFQSRWGSDLKFNWKSGIRKSPNSRDEFDAKPNKNLTELNTSGWKVTKEIIMKGNKSPDYYNHQKPFVRNNLPPVILKTAQCFYKNKGVVKDSPSDEFIKIEKPTKYKKKLGGKNTDKISSASHLLEYPTDENTVSFAF